MRLAFHSCRQKPLNNLALSYTSRAVHTSAYLLLLLLIPTKRAKSRLPCLASGARGSGAKLKIRLGVQFGVCIHFSSLLAPHNSPAFKSKRLSTPPATNYHSDRATLQMGSLPPRRQPSKLQNKQVVWAQECNEISSFSSLLKALQM